MFSRFLKSTLLFLFAFSLNAHGTIANLSHTVHAKHEIKQTEGASITKTQNSDIIDLYNGQNSAAHLTSQNYKPGQLFKQLAILNRITFASLGCSKYISRSSQVSFSRFIKLVLFPFHAFW